MSITYCVVILFCFSSSCVPYDASFSGCKFSLRYSLTFISSECMEKPYRAHLLSSDDNHHALVYSFFRTLSSYTTSLTCKSNLQLKEKHPQKVTPPHRTVSYPSGFHHKMQCFYAARLECGHAWGTQIFNLRLTNGIVSNYEYSKGDCHVTTSIKPADDVMIVEVDLWVTLRTGAAHCYNSLQIHDPQN